MKLDEQTKKELVAELDQMKKKIEEMKLFSVLEEKYAPKNKKKPDKHVRDKARERIRDILFDYDSERELKMLFGDFDDVLEELAKAFKLKKMTNEEVVEERRKELIKKRGLVLLNDKKLEMYKILCEIDSAFSENSKEEFVEHFVKTIYPKIMEIRLQTVAIDRTLKYLQEEQCTK